MNAGPDIGFSTKVSRFGIGARSLPKCSSQNQGSRKRVFFLSDPTTKALTPPPPSPSGFPYLFFDDFFLIILFFVFTNRNINTKQRNVNKIDEHHGTHIRW